MSFANVSTVALFVETTVGTPPADWDASGLPLYTIGIPDISGLQQTFLEDERSRNRALEVHDKIPGLKSTAGFSFSIPAHGHAQGVIADTSAAANTTQAKMVSHSLGGQKITDSTTLAVAGTHTTTSLELTDSSTYEIGGFVVIQDADATGAVVTYTRRILSKALDVVGLDEELPFTPVDGDPLHSSIQNYIDEDVLCDSSAAPSTHAYAIVRGGSAAPVAWQVVGSQANLTEFTIDSNAAVTMGFEVMAGSFSEPDVFSVPTFTNPLTGSPAFVAGLGTRLHIQDVGTTTSTCVNAAEISITPGVTSVPVPTVTECDVGLEGIAGHVVQPGDTLVAITRMPYSTDTHADLKTQTRKIVRYSNNLPPGSGFAVHFSNCEINATPVSAEADNRLATGIEFRAHEDDAIAGAVVVEQQVAKLSVLMW